MDDLRDSFVFEANELLDEAEQCLLLVEKGESLQAHFNVIFRAFHSVKGGASMFEMKSVQSCLHEAETKLDGIRQQIDLSSDVITYFLQAINRARDNLSKNLVDDAVENTDKTTNSKKLNPESSKAAPADVALKLVSNCEMASPTKRAVTDTSRLRVMIVDDEPEMTEVLFEILDEKIFLAKVFNNPLLALPAVGEFKPDVVFCDMKMPQMLGLEFLKKLKQMKDPPPLIFISGYLTKEILIEAVNFGAEGVIEKPFDEGFIIKSAQNAAAKKRGWDSFNRTINLMLYQYSEFDDYLIKSGKDHVKKLVDDEINNLMEQRTLLRGLNRGVA